MRCFVRCFVFALLAEGAFGIILNSTDVAWLPSVESENFTIREREPLLQNNDTEWLPLVELENFPQGDNNTFTCIWNGPVDGVLIFIATTKCLELKNPQLNVSTHFYDREMHSQVQECLKFSRQKSETQAEMYDLKTIKQYIYVAEQLISTLNESKKSISEDLICRQKTKLTNLNEEDRTFVDVVCEAFKLISILNRTTARNIIQQICTENTTIMADPEQLL